ncbi:MAG: hypothetical protein FWH10_03690 [Oscillospiraceae bacterium]|nr:hypothetical protein [Oscillospiraceae bacterium]
MKSFWKDLKNNLDSSIIDTDGVKTMNVGKSFDEDILRLPDIEVGRSLGAKFRNYDIMLPDGEIANLTEGSIITNIEVIAGKGKNRKIDIADTLVGVFGGEIYEWQKVKGIGYIDFGGISFKAELHWYQEPTIGKVWWKIKVDRGGNWFINED